MNIPTMQFHIEKVQVTDENICLWLEHNAKNGRKFPDGTYGSSKYENPYHAAWNGSSEVELLFWNCDERL